jgi:hypothetical protein
MAVDKCTLCALFCTSEDNRPLDIRSKKSRSTLLQLYRIHANDGDIRFGSRHLHPVEGTLVRHVPDLRSAEVAYLLPTAARSVSQPCGIVRRRLFGALEELAAQLGEARSTERLVVNTNA